MLKITLIITFCQYFLILRRILIQKKINFYLKSKGLSYSPKTLDALGQLIKDIEHSAQDWRTFPAIIYKRNFEDGRFNFLRMNEFLKIFNEKLELEQQIKVEPSQTAKSTLSALSTLSTAGSFKI